VHPQRAKVPHMRPASDVGPLEHFTRDKHRHFMDASFERNAFDGSKVSSMPFLGVDSGVRESNDRVKGLELPICEQQQLTNAAIRRAWRWWT
jgi:hypothetical protein